ncbi:hypothetical protein ROE7235_01617 [Roseibaca ekhonensis]|uniref:EamA domain-containing protein n=1 Tax=Roseinatronobacter ekhonensis TaxID=254356 RepID=A0A3B0MVL6_9RHOB|nr:DMT family transporter [Roseibaca ekhonensis]SUZ31866.1 hypothetical protein ROE7235_01617 [Roseibaca ekhonensis]
MPEDRSWPRPLASAVLIAAGVLWGLGAPFVRYARLGGMEAFSLVLWHSFVGLVVIGAILALRGRLAIPRDAASLRLYLAVGVLGIFAPHIAGYWALGWVPAGVHALLTSLVPIFALAVALALRIERFRPVRALGLALGAGAIALIVLPEASLPQGVAIGFVLVSALAPLCYALESAYVAHISTASAGAMQALFGGSIIAVALCLVTTWAAGQPLLPDSVDLRLGAVALSGAGGALAYALYVTLLRRAGSLFATQVAYIVTLSAMLWAVLLLGERPAPTIWAAMVLIFAGLALVRPKHRRNTV